MSKQNLDFRYTGILGTRKQVASLGAFFLIVFGVPFLILFMDEPEMYPAWLIPFFATGIVLGIILLLGASFAIDTKEN